MRKLWIALSITLVLGLTWCTIPSFGGWSWAADPLFVIEGEEGDVVAVNAIITVGFDGNAKKFQPKRVKVVLNVPDGTNAEVLNDGGFNVKVKDDYDEEDQVELRVVVKGNCSLLDVDVKVTRGDDDTPILPDKEEADEWVFKFDLS